MMSLIQVNSLQNSGVRLFFYAVSIYAAAVLLP